MRFSYLLASSGFKNNPFKKLDFPIPELPITRRVFSGDEEGSLDDNEDELCFDDCDVLDFRRY